MYECMKVLMHVWGDPGLQTHRYIFKLPLSALKLLFIALDYIYEASHQGNSHTFDLDACPDQFTPDYIWNYRISVHFY